MDFDHLSRQLSRQAMRRLKKSQGIVEKQNDRVKRRLERGLDKPFPIADAVRELAKDATSK